MAALRRERRKEDDSKIHFVEGPGGIVTAGGVRFKTTVGMLRKFAAPVLDRVGLDVLLKRAEVWLDSGRTIALWLLPVLLLVLPPLAAAILVLAVYLVWEILSPSFPSVILVGLLTPLQHPAAQGIYYALLLTWLYLGGDVAASIVGVVLFVLFRLEVVARVARPVLRKSHQNLYTLEVPDQVLRALILRAAMHHGINMAQLSDIESDVRTWWSRGRKR
ncbi:hypothetical protein BH23BAC4_BH23BAC4_08860 [soil metagenome]